MPSILNIKIHRVFKYLNKYDFNNIKLTIYILNSQFSLNQIVTLEQHFLNTLNLSFNIDILASSFKYHKSITQNIREKLYKERDTSVYIYNIKNLNLLYIFELKQNMYNTINIYHKTLTDCLYLNLLYLNYFFYL